MKSASTTMSVPAFLISLQPHEYEALHNSTLGGETLDEIVRLWAAKNKPDITLADNEIDDGEDHSKPFMVTDDNGNDITAEFNNDVL